MSLPPGPQTGPPPGWGPPSYGPPPGWVPVRPTSTLAIIALVCAAVAPPVGVLLAWLALKETHPVTGSKGGRQLATVALWVNVGLTALALLFIGSVFAQLLGYLAFALPVITA